MWSVWGKAEVYTVLVGYLSKRGLFENIGVGEKVILKYISKK